MAPEPGEDWSTGRSDPPPYGPANGIPSYPQFPADQPMDQNTGSRYNGAWADPSGQPLRLMAEWWQRAVALVLDGVIMAVLIYLIILLIGGSGHSAGTRPGAATGNTFAVDALAFFAQILYFAILDGKGQSIGKRIIGIAVRDKETGQPIGFGRAFLRWLVYSALWLVFTIPGLINVISPLWDKDRQAWHDHAARSVVLKIPRT